MSSPVSNLNNFEIKRDGKNQEYVETCGDWVRATLVMFDDEPHVRIQEHHETGSGRLHLGPLVPLDQWSAFKESVDRLVGPYIREPRRPLARRTLPGALDRAILEVVAARRRQNTIGGWGTLVLERIPEPASHNDLLFAFKRLWERGFLSVTKPDGREYSGNPSDDHWFFFMDSFNAEMTTEGSSYWESLKG